MRRFLDIRPGEGLPVLLTFLYIWIVVASFLLAKPIRSGLFLGEHEAYDLVYVYAAVPLVLTLFVPLYTRVAARFGARTVTVGDADRCSASTSCCSGTCSAFTRSAGCRTSFMCG